MMGDLFWRLVVWVIVISTFVGMLFWDANLTVDLMFVGLLAVGLLYLQIEHHIHARLKPEREKFSPYQLRLLSHIPQRLDNHPQVRVEICPLFKRTQASK
jgi:hypothetical protein